jgi:hypothetical protein
MMSWPGEVQVEPGMLQQQLVNRRRLVGGVVVQHQVQVQLGPGDGGIYELQEPEEFLR